MSFLCHRCPFVFVVLSNVTRIDVLQNNFTNPRGQQIIVEEIVMDPSSGTYVLTKDKTAMTYSPPSNPMFTGQTKFEYEACLDDGLESACDRASVTISVKAPIVARDNVVSVLSRMNGTRTDVF